MLTKKFIGLALGLLASCMFASDPDQHPELLSQFGMDELADEGKLSFRISLNDDISYRFKTRIDGVNFQLHYLNEGNNKDIDHTASLALSSKFVDAGLGRGSPHIARGLVLGSTMMRYGADPNTNIGYCRTQTKVKNYSYNDELVFVRGHYRSFSAGGFRVKDVFALNADFTQDNMSAACFVYFMDVPLVEAYWTYHNDKLRTCLDFSIFKKRLNHMCGDLLYRDKKLKYFMSFAHCDEQYTCIDADSKWGSGLKAGSTGLATGCYLKLKDSKLCMSAIRIRAPECREDKVIADFNYRQNKSEIFLSLNYRLRKILEVNNQTPALLVWNDASQVLYKVKLKHQISRSLQIIIQMQMNAMDFSAYSMISRLSYKTGDTKLLLQLSQASKGESDLYYLRPLTASTYSIRKAGKAGVFYDLVFEKKFNKVKIGILLRSEGLSFNLSI